MKAAILCIAGGLVFLLTSASTLHAQDWKKSNPTMKAVLVDTTLVRAMVVTIEPGQRSNSHSHPANFF